MCGLVHVRSAFVVADPRTITKEWAHATHLKKMGKKPIYWETKAAAGGDDDY